MDDQHKIEEVKELASVETTEIQINTEGAMKLITVRRDDVRR